MDFSLDLFIDINFPSEGPVICNDRVKTVVVDHPVEECALEPVKSCHQVTGSPQSTALTSPRSVCPGDEAGAQASARGGVCGRAEGNLCPVQDEPSQGEAACHQEVVLCALPGVGSLLTGPLSSENSPGN